MLPNQTDKIAKLGGPRSNPGVVIDDFVRYLVSHSPKTPCEAIANVYQEIVPSDKRFQVALDVLLPILSTGTEVCILLHDILGNLTGLLTDFFPDSCSLCTIFTLFDACDQHESIPLCTT
jgi:hypothetical protein